MIHYANTDVPGVLVSKQRIRVVDGANKNAIQNGEGKLRGNQPPESMLHRLMHRDGVHDAINNELRNP